MAKFEVINPVFLTIGNAAHTLHQISSIGRGELSELLLSGEEAPTDGVGNIRIASVILTILEFDGLVTFGLLQKKPDDYSEEEFEALLFRPTKERLKALYQFSGATAQLGEEPLQTVMRIVKLRNDLVHPKVENECKEIEKPSRGDLIESIDGSFVELTDPESFTLIRQKFDEASRQLRDTCSLVTEAPRATAVS
ncbi:hypothetical protein OCL06_07390 [Alteromonas sp. ASW11-19]|uniref:Uncharacterized protein n=1 Tax=Alteromonas salexigens TaxID=2982530 RepID=A0ABT2VNG9_9ALTE|nr:hypothetical protein [Alteromonas salexigens]MCU7554417.1 hypothetical protein [Alteromonas salexigens]